MDVEGSVTKIGSLRVYLGASPLYLCMQTKATKILLCVCGDVFLLEPICGISLFYLSLFQTLLAILFNISARRDEKPR